MLAVGDELLLSEFNNLNIVELFVTINNSFLSAIDIWHTDSYTMFYISQMHLMTRSI